MKFGALLRDREISFSSGFARADPKGGLQSGQGGESQAAPVLWRAETIAAIKEVQPGVWFTLWLVFVAAVTLGATMRPLWYQLAAALWFGSYLVAPQIASMAPLWLRGLLSGATAILAAADIIHAHPASEAARHRRVILLLAGALFFGASLGQVQPGQMDSTRGWVALLLLSALALSAILTGLRVLSGPADSASRRICVQLAALACCGGGIFAMLRLLEVI